MGGSSMNEQNQKPEWFALADADKANSPSRFKKSAKVTLLAFPLAAVLAGVAYANLHQEPAANADSPVTSQSSATPAVAINSATPTTHSRTVTASTISLSRPPQVGNQEDDAQALGAASTAAPAKAAPANPITKAPKGHGGEGRENNEGGEGDD